MGKLCFTSSFFIDMFIFKNDMALEMSSFSSLHFVYQLGILD